jgi:hypothetical protein
VLVACLTANVVVVVGSVERLATIVVVDAKRGLGGVTSYNVLTRSLHNILRNTCPLPPTPYRSGLQQSFKVCDLDAVKYGTVQTWL